jgi:hypothetical protein
MSLTKETTRTGPTGAPYWRTVVERTSSGATSSGAAATPASGSYSQVTAIEGLRDVDALVVLAAASPRTDFALQPLSYRSSLPLASLDITWTLLAAGSLEIYSPTGGDRPLVEPVDVEAPQAYVAFKKLGEWLDADDDEVARAIGIGRTTPYAWRRDGHEPRAATVRRLYELHTVLDAMRRELGRTRFLAWLSVGSPSRRDALLNGDLAAVAKDVDTLLFAATRTPDLAWAPERPKDSAADIEPFEARPSERAKRSPSI